jgi:large conductance mechanosensitive channel
MNGFKEFFYRGNLVELAVAVGIGAAFSGLVTAFVNSFIGPLIALMGEQPDFNRLSFTIDGTRFPYGIFLTALISFLIVAAVVYFLVVLPMTKLLERFVKAEDATKRPCPHCLTRIPVEASRCGSCTMEVAAPSGQTPEV